MPRLRASDDPSVLANAAQALAYLGADISTMMVLVDRALVLNPSSARGWLVSGILRNWAGQPDIAIEHLGASLRLSRAPESALGLLPQSAMHISSAALMRQYRSYSSRSKRIRASRTRIAISPPATRNMGLLDDAREIVEQHRAIAPVVMTDTHYLRYAEHRELYLSGLRLAAGETT